MQQASERVITEVYLQILSSYSSERNGQVMSSYSL